MSLLQCTDLTVRFGGLVALSQLSLRAEPGTLVGLIGPNGAGKTTFIDALTGFVPSTGRVEFDGRDVADMKPTDRARAGLGRSWQSIELFDDMSVLENLGVAAQRSTLRQLTRDFLGMPRAVSDPAIDLALDLVGIGDLRDRLPGELSHGQRKLVGVARAIAASPKLLCMDEPAAGLDTSESMALGARLRDIVSSGITVLLVDHDMGLVLSVCDYLFVIDFGRLIAEGTPGEIRRDNAVIEAYLGSHSSADAK